MAFFTLPDGYRPVPLDATNGSFSWNVNLLFDERSRALVVLANLPDSKAYLGCLVDSEGNGREWLQIWVQDFDPIAGTCSDQEVATTNLRLEARWNRHWDTVRRISRDAMVTSIPKEAAQALHIDLGTGKVVVPVPPSGGRWVLCRDDETLTAAGLPSYSGSVYRFLTVEPPVSGSVIDNFVAAGSTAESVAAHKAALPSPRLGFGAEWMPINPQAGPMVIRRHPIFDLEDYVRLLNGTSLAEIAEEKSACERAALADITTSLGGDGRRHGLLLSGNSGIEILFLKLRLFLQACRAVYSHLAAQQTPLLNLDPSAFGISFPHAGPLPWPWTSTCEIVRPGRVLRIEVPDTGESRFVALGSTSIAIYCPAGQTTRTDITAAIQLSNPTWDGLTGAFDGRATMSRPEHVDPSDILRFRLNGPGMNFDCHGRISAETTGMRREIRFRTLPRTFSQAQANLLAKGGRFERSWCELVPVLGAPHDFYSLAMIGARSILVHDRNPLDSVADELDRFARALAETFGEHDSERGIIEKVLAMLKNPDAWPALNPTQCLGGKLSGVTRDIPPTLWASVILNIIRLLPGVGRFSFAPDYGSSNPGQIELPLQAHFDSLEPLVARTRSLIFSDWQANREIQAVLASLREAAVNGTWSGR